MSGDNMVDRLSYHVRRVMPRDWISHTPLAFESNRPGLFIARISGDAFIFGAKRMGRYWEMEGYGPSLADAMQDLLDKLAGPA